MTEAPEKRSSNRTLIIVLVVLGALGCIGIGGLVGLVIVLIPKGQYEAAKTQDLNNLRRMAGEILLRERKAPIAADGRLHIYEVLRAAGRSNEEIAEICHCFRRDEGPTREEVERDDYSNFPYQRFKGPYSRERPVFLLWDPVPRKDQRLAADNRGAARVMDEEAMRAFFDANPGQAGR